MYRQHCETLSMKPVSSTQDPFEMNNLSIMQRPSTQLYNLSLSWVVPISWILFLFVFLMSPILVLLDPAFKFHAYVYAPLGYSRLSSQILSGPFLWRIFSGIGSFVLSSWFLPLLLLTQLLWIVLIPFIVLSQLLSLLRLLAYWN